MNQLRLEFFGTFQVNLNQHPVTAFESNKVRALLAYLAVESAQAQPRTRLAGLFWPEILENSARSNLRHSLSNLRKLLHHDLAEPPFLLIDRQTVQFNPKRDFFLDVAEFGVVNRAKEEQVSLLDRSISLYKGPFLRGFFLDGCSEFEEWLLLTRERFHNQAVNALYRLIAHFEKQQAFDQAESYARKLIALDNLQEKAHSSLMRLLAHQGQRSAALSQYEQCRQLLATELGIEPKPETAALHQQIQRGDWKTSSAPLISEISRRTTDENAVAPSQIQHNLPSPTTSFVGRAQEVVDICGLLRQPEVRLLTLDGAGGIGKTRLALQAARQLVDDFADGCIWVELAPLQSTTQIPPTILQRLGIGESAGQNPLQRLKNHLRHKSILLVLDNYEHLLEAASLVSDLLSYAEHLKCLVTSREPLHLRGEYEFSVPALLTPNSAHSLDSANFMTYEAVQLFVQRAQAVKPDFSLDRANRAVVAEICGRLDGLPLAIELAAARCKFFSAKTLQQKLESSRLCFLRGTRDMPDRHQTLQDVIDWSYHLLSPIERRFFPQLAIFIGEFTLDAVTQVCVLDEDDIDDVQEVLLSLVDKNLVRLLVAEEGGSRFLLLETIREFAMQRLIESDSLELIQQSHAAYYLGMAEQWCPQLIGKKGIVALVILRQLYPNLRAALQWYLANGKSAQSIRFCNLLLSYWNTDNGDEAMSFFKSALHLADSAPLPEYINALANAGYASLVLNTKGMGQAYFEQCLTLNKSAGNVGDPIEISIANGLLGWIKFGQEDYQSARAYLAAAKENDIATGAEWPLAMTLANQGTMEAKLGEFEKAQHFLQEALAIMHRIGDPWGIASCLLRQSWLYCFQSNFTEASNTLEQSYPICLELKADAMFAEYYCLSALVAMERGEVHEVNRLIKQSLLIRQKQGVPRYIHAVLETLLTILVSQGKNIQVLVIAGAIHAYRQSQNLVAPPVEKKFADEALLLAQQELTQSEIDVAEMKGQAMLLDEAMSYALSEI